MLALDVYEKFLKGRRRSQAVASGRRRWASPVYGRILGVFVCAAWLFQVEKFHCCAFCAHLVACFAFAKQLHTT